METYNHEILLHSSFVRQKEYWCEKLAPDTMLTTFRAVDVPVRQDGSSQQEKVDIVFSESVKERLSAFSKGSDLSMYICLLTVLKVLIHRYTGQRDITVISPISLMNVTETTLNENVWIRDQWEGDITFRELIMQVKDSVIEAYQNQDYPSGQLLWHIFQQEGDIAQPPFTDICCLLDSLHNGCETLNLNENASFCFHKENSGVSGHILFNATCLSHTCVQRLALHYAALLDYFLEEKNAEIGDAEFLSPEETERLLKGFNATVLPEVQNSTVLDMFLHQVEKNPEALAVASPALSFSELDHRSDIFAGILADKGVKTGDITAVMMPRSVDFIITILAILKCRAAFLPIDISYPVERRKFMIEDSGARAVIMSEDQMSRDQEGLGRTSVAIIQMDSTELEADEPQSVKKPQTDDAAYVIYTSGSSGRPKGAVVDHRNLANYISWAANTYVRDEILRFPLYTSISFDLTVTSIFTPLATGSSIVIYGEEEPGLLVDRIFSSDEVDIVKCTPSHLKLVREKAGSMKRSGTIRRMIVGGESLEPDLSAAISSQFGDKIEIYNEYGPTETTVGCILHRFVPGVDTGESVPIGKPASNVQVYVLNEKLKPSPIGGVGELYISGEGVARGYLNRPELTAECFLPNPFLPGTLMYKTGDLGRWLPDGSLMFLGRQDRQLKLRGVRVELGEIESLLRKSPGLKEAVVLGLNNERGVTLAAFLIPSSPVDSLEVQGLRDFLGDQLPAYIVPTLYYKVTEIPLTPNGKVDEKALRKSGVLLNPSAHYVAPRNEMEQTLVGIWKEVLGIEQVGIKDNFFEIGGTSLDLLKVNRLFNDRFQKDIQVVTLFSYPNIDAFCSFLRQSERGVSPTLDIAGFESASQSRSRLGDRKKRLIRRESE